MSMMLVMGTVVASFPSSARAGPEPPPLPATVVIIPEGEMRRTRLAAESATKTEPSGPTASAETDAKVADVAGTLSIDEATVALQGAEPPAKVEIEYLPLP